MIYTIPIKYRQNTIKSAIVRIYDNKQFDVNQFKLTIPCIPNKIVGEDYNLSVGAN